MDSTLKSSLASVTLNEGKKLLKERMDFIMKFKQKTKLSSRITLWSAIHWSIRVKSLSSNRAVFSFLFDCSSFSVSNGRIEDLDTKQEEYKKWGITRDEQGNFY